MADERLSKFLAGSGVASRRKSEEIIRSGRVRVGGAVVADPHFVLDPEHTAVTVDGKNVREVTRRYYIALYKPAGYLSDLTDPKGRRLARQLIDLEAPLFPVGRLDYNSEGLILFTNDGEFANAVMHPRYEVEKEYLVKLSGTLSRDEMKRMTSGIRIEGVLCRARAITLVRETKANAWYDIVVTEGRNRMIRKMATALMHPVLKLKRVRIGAITLGHLRPGEYRHVHIREVLPLQKAK